MSDLMSKSKFVVRDYYHPKGGEDGCLSRHDTAIEAFAAGVACASYTRCVSVDAVTPEGFYSLMQWIDGVATVPERWLVRGRR